MKLNYKDYIFFIAILAVITLSTVAGHFMGLRKIAAFDEEYSNRKAEMEKIFKSGPEEDDLLSEDDRKKLAYMERESESLQIKFRHQEIYFLTMRNCQFIGALICIAIFIAFIVFVDRPAYNKLTKQSTAG